MSRLLICVLLVACAPQRMDPPFQPFQIPPWKTLPTDEEIVKAIVGTGGSLDERIEADRLARELLLPNLRRDKELVSLLWSLKLLKMDYESAKKSESRNAFLRFAVSQAVSDIRSSAGGIAAARLKLALWPDEPFPEEWQNATGVDLATSASTAAALARRMKELEDRYGDRLAIFGTEAPRLGTVEFGEHRSISIARNHLHVALTGDYSITSGSIFRVLSRRGVTTQRLPGDSVY